MVTKAQISIFVGGIVAIFLVLGGGWYFLSQENNKSAEMLRIAQEKQTEALQMAEDNTSIVDTSNGSTSLTAGWKIYRNDKYAFEMKYPTEWIFEESVSEYVVFYPEGTKKQNEEEQQIGIALVIYSKDIQPEVNDYVQFLNLSTSDFQSAGDIVIGEQNAKIYYGVKNSIASTLAGFIYNDLIFHFANSITGDSTLIFKQILSTFKFIE